MYICIYVYISMYIYVYIYVYAYVYMYRYVYIFSNSLALAKPRVMQPTKTYCEAAQPKTRRKKAMQPRPLSP